MNIIECPEHIPARAPIGAASIASGHPAHVNATPNSKRPHIEWRHEQRETAVMALFLRSSFRLIAKFLFERSRSMPAAHHAGTVLATLEFARITFSLALRQPCWSASFRADCAQCLEDLESLAAALSGGDVPPTGHLAHALDTVLVLLLEIHAANFHSIDPTPSFFTTQKERTCQP